MKNIQSLKIKKSKKKKSQLNNNYEIQETHVVDNDLVMTETTPYDEMDIDDRDLYMKKFEEYQNLALSVFTKHVIRRKILQVA